MDHNLPDNSLSPDEWNTAQTLVEVVRKNDMGSHIIIYFEDDFSAINEMSPLSDLVIISPLDSATVRALSKKKLLDVEFRHGDELYIVTLRQEIYAAVDAGLKRGRDTLL
ncbi:MAG: hypothetical protein IT327_28650 [Anaerolineae bacterium]|nr:hypothetical protein [Anaerolineae bacterium]